MPTLAAVLLLAALVHLPGLAGPLQFDDLATIAVDPGAQSLAAWWADAGRHVRPLTKASFAMTHSLGAWLGDVPAAHHAGNVMLHVAAVAALYALGRRLAGRWAPGLGVRGAHAAASWAAAAFALHPLGSEAVDYLSGRSMALGTLLATLSVLAYARWRERGGAAGLAAAGIAAIAAFLARETAFIAPLLWLAWETADRAGRAPASPVPAPATLGTTSAEPPGDPAHRRWPAQRPAALLGVALVISAATWLLLHPRYAPLLELSARIAVLRMGEPTLTAALEHFVHGLALLRYPSIDPDVDPARIGTGGRLAAFALTVVAGGLAWRARRIRPWLLFAFAWTLLWIVPLYGLRVRHDALAERHFYPAVWAVAFALAASAIAGCRGAGADATRSMAAIARWRPRALAAIGAAALLAMAVVTAVRSADYRSEIALWEAARRSAPAKPRVLNNLGVAYMLAGRWEDAESVLARAAALDPLDERVIDNLLSARERDLGIPGHAPAVAR